MFTVKILSVGKSKEIWLNTAIDEYEKRLSPYMNIDWTLVKDDQSLIKQVVKLPNYICLDPMGKSFTSIAFSTYLISELEKNGSRLNLIIGGADGISKQILDKSQGLISLSSMTFTHQMTRLILLEQLYRGIQIHLNTGYHKD